MIFQKCAKFLRKNVQFDKPLVTVWAVLKPSISSEKCPNWCTAWSKKINFEFERFHYKRVFIGLIEHLIIGEFFWIVDANPHSTCIILPASMEKLQVWNLYTDRGITRSEVRKRKVGVVVVGLQPRSWLVSKQAAAAVAAASVSTLENWCPVELRKKRTSFNFQGASRKFQLYRQSFRIPVSWPSSAIVCASYV